VESKRDAEIKLQGTINCFFSHKQATGPESLLQPILNFGLWRHCCFLPLPLAYNSFFYKEKKKLYLYADCRFDKESRLQPEPYPSPTLTFSDSACAKDVEMKMKSGGERNG
jgi:hypothetical protein